MNGVKNVLIIGIAAAVVLTTAGPATAAGGSTSRVSVSSAGAQGNGNSFESKVSADGRYVVFNSTASNLVPGDTNGFEDVFLRDRRTGSTTRISVSSSGAQANGDSFFPPAISADDRFVAFTSRATNLVRGDTNDSEDVFVRNLQTGTTSRVSVPSTGGEAIGPSFSPSLSADGRYVAFFSIAGNLVPGDNNDLTDTFVRDREAMTTTLISVSTLDAQGNGDSPDPNSGGPAITSDGRFVAFSSHASNLVRGDTNGVPDMFVRDRQNSTTSRVSVSSSELQGDGTSGFEAPALGSNGRYVAFTSAATNLVTGDTNGGVDVFVRDRSLGTTARMNVTSSGGQSSGDGVGFGNSLGITGDGRFVVFSSIAGDLVPGDTNGRSDVFLRDRQANTTTRVSLTSAEKEVFSDCHRPSIGGGGRFISFESAAPRLVPNDTNGHFDVFVRDRQG
jgi:Tol biopolymer transport system component